MSRNCPAFFPPREGERVSDGHTSRCVAGTCLRRVHFWAARNGRKSGPRASPWESRRPCLCSVLWSAPKSVSARAVRFTLFPAASDFCPAPFVPIWLAWLRPLGGTARDGQKKPLHNQRTEKTSRVFYGLGEALPGVENHRRPHSRFGGFQRALPLVTLCPTFLVSQKGGPSETRPPLGSGRIPQRSKKTKKIILSSRVRVPAPPGPLYSLSLFLIQFLILFLFLIRPAHVSHPTDICRTHARHMHDICSAYVMHPGDFA